MNNQKDNETLKKYGAGVGGTILACLLLPTLIAGVVSAGVWYASHKYFENE